MSRNHRSGALFSFQVSGLPRKRSGLFLASLAPFLAGCATHPLPEDVTRKTTHNIVQQVRCEAKRAVVERAGALGDAAISYEFEFNIKEHNGASGNFTLGNPFQAGAFSLTASAGSDRTREAIRNFKIVDSFDELRKTDCSPETQEKNWIYPLAGEVGMYEAVSTFVKLQRVENPVGKELFTFADTLNFTTTFDGGVTSKLTLNPVTDRLRVTEANASLGASRTDFHKLVVTMSAGPQVVATRISRGGRLVEGRAGIRAFGGGIPGNSLLSTTLVQQGSSAKDRTLYELDRQRTLEFQRRAINLLGGP
jgi:hypothetical protein